ncbi:MAG TPA: L,D-transpeptidase, partial [Verrucomicrobiae bacterium]|nr:L,D-transpeptidase [Verrucomicrobiae bacterium]
MLRSTHSFVLSLPIFFSVLVSAPGSTGEPGANPLDPAGEDLSRIEYPSLNAVPWEPRFIRPHETLESLFGDDWVTVARFNRIDRRHTYPGMTIKVPVNMGKARSYSPLPPFYEPARDHARYILVSRSEQWIGAYEYGRLKFSLPAATGKEGHETPVGVFRVDARHRPHTSSLYTTDNGEDQYPMDYAFRFHIGPDGVSYWIHSRDLPGKPASHGCVGVY